MNRIINVRPVLVHYRSYNASINLIGVICIFNELDVDVEYFYKGHILLMEEVRSAFYKELQFHCFSCTYTVPHYWYSKMYFVEPYHNVE